MLHLVRSALPRERVSDDGGRLPAGITRIFPNRPLTREIDRITAIGYRQ